MRAPCLQENLALRRFRLGSAVLLDQHAVPGLPRHVRAAIEMLHFLMRHGLISVAAGDALFKGVSMAFRWVEQTSADSLLRAFRTLRRT
jgi:hypothetical protein